MSLSNQNLLDPWMVYESPQVNWDPHNGQIKVLNSHARHKLWCAGRRTGKSELGGHVLLPEAFYTRYVADEWLKKGKRREFWIVGDEYTTAEKEFRVIWHLIESLGMPMDHPGSYYNAEGGSMHIKLWGGAFQIHAQSAKYPDHLVGEALCGVLMVEAAKTKMSIWQKYIRPMLNDYEGWSLHTSTPEGKNHFYDKYEMGQDPYNTEWESWRMPAWLNPYVYTPTGRLIAAGKLPPDTIIPDHEWTTDADVKFMLQQLEDHPNLSAAQVVAVEKLHIDKEIVDLADDLTLELFKQEIAADFTEFVGQVFKDYDEEYHVSNLTYNPDWQTFGAVDYGFTNPNVWLLVQVGPWGEINVLDEVYEYGLTADAFAAEIIRRRLNPPGLRLFYPDPADPMSSRTLQDKLRVQSAGGTGGELNIRLNLIRQALRKGRVDYQATELSDSNADTWRPQLMFDRKCTRTRADMMAYRYPEQKEDGETSVPRMELPMKKDDHGPEALGRFMMGFFGAGSLLGSGGTKVRRANMGRHVKPRDVSQHYQKPIPSMRPTATGFPDWREWLTRGER